MRGNARGCVYTEPMWGLSMNLFIPYMSVYMLAVGLNDVNVGIVASAFTVSRVFFAFLSGAITDKFGRRKSVAVFDALSWCIPCVFWLFAVDIKFFIAASVFNGMMMVPVNSWSCLMIEDTDKSKITHVYTWIMISNHLTTMFSPISAILISRYTLIPAMRILFVNAIILFTVKIILLYIISRETAIGTIRMEETKNQSYFTLLKGYAGVVSLIKKSRGILFSITIAALFAIISMINSTFWQILVSKKLEIPVEILPYFTMFRSVIALVFFFTIIARINQLRLKNPLLIGFASFFAGQLILILIPGAGPVRYVLLCCSLVFDGLGAGILVMLSESMIAMHAGLSERAGVLAVNQMIIMAISAPFGWIGGLLSNVSKNLPFALNLTLICAGVILTLIYYRAKPHFLADAPAPPDANGSA